MKTPQCQSVPRLIFYKVTQIMELMYKSKNWVMKWSVRGETGEFVEGVFTESHFNNSKSEDERK